MQIFEITAKKSIQEAGWFSRATLGALGDKLDAYNFAQAGLTRPGASGNPYGDYRAKAAAAADPLINQMAADEMARWNQQLNSAMKSTGAKSLAALPVRTKVALSDSFMNRVYGYFLDNQVGSDLTQFPKMVDTKSQSEANTLLTQLQQATRAIRNYNSPASTPEGQFQQWRTLSKITYDMRSLMQFNPANRSVRAAPKQMPAIELTGSGLFKIGNTTLNTRVPVQKAIHDLFMSMMPSPTSPEPVIALSPRGDIAVNGVILRPTDPEEAEAIKIIKSEIQRLNP
jgi:hypothetical protein